MAFVVEDGSGSANANSYSTVEEADACFADRGNVQWVGTDEAKQSWLVQATDYIDARFGGRFKGERQYTLAPEQALEFPRIGINNVQPNSVPVVLRKACAEYALRAKAGALAPDPVVDESGFAIQSKREKVGPIEEHTVFQTGDGASINLLRPYPAADMLLRGLLSSVAGGRVIRS